MSIPATEQDLEQIWRWNETFPPAIEDCVHRRISETVEYQPDALAVDAWDGQLTYRRLDDLSTRLADHILDSGTRPQENVSLYFEKSVYTPVAILAVMKAGCTCILLDERQPEQRLKAIVKQLQPRLALSSRKHIENARSTCDSATVIAVDQEFLDNLPPISTALQLPNVSPTTTIFITYTSGSSGVPKCPSISHSNVCSAVHYQGRKLGFTQQSKVLDFAPYSFDVSWSNLLHTLCAGGRVCIASMEDMLNDLEACIARFDVNMINLTPTVLRGLDLDRCPSLKDVLLSGEKPGMNVLTRFASRVRLKNTYGPAESTWKSAFAAIDPLDIQESNIGYGVGARTWIVDPEQHDTLVAIGEEGELWLEGPLVGQGYANDPERTTPVFVTDPPWLLRGGTNVVGRPGRLYRTGDLVRYNPDGSLNFIGRKDTQAKIAGQRVELSEVEYQITHNVPRSPVVVAEVVVPKNHDAGILVAFFETQGERISALLPEQLQEQLSRFLPAHMIPSAYIHVGKMPLTGTGKTDRRELREFGAGMTMQELVAPPSAKCKKRAPASDVEHRLRSIWASVLNIEVNSIGLDDSFLRLGGDSIKAMMLVRGSREDGLHLTVADVFRYPRLFELATIVQEVKDPEADKQRIPPFSLLPRSDDGSDVAAEAGVRCGIPSDQVEDVYPLTPLQLGMFALTTKTDGNDAYLSTYVRELTETVDLEQFKTAWEGVAAHTPLLRTRVARLKAETDLVQVVVREPLQWFSDTDLASCLAQRSRKVFAVNEPLAEFGLVGQQGGNGKPRRYFVWRMHHAVFDGWSRRLILRMVEQAYQGMTLSVYQPYQSYIRYVLDTDHDAAVIAWKNRLSGNRAPTFPNLPFATDRVKANASMSRSINGLTWSEGSVTPATMIQTAWAVLTEQYTGCEDVVFGLTVSGRHADVPGIDNIPGPTIATIPYRLTLDYEEEVGQLLRRGQNQTFEMIPWEHIGLMHIREASTDARQACQFQTLIVVQPAIPDVDSVVFESEQNEDVDQLPNTYALALACQLSATGVDVQARYDPQVVSRDQVDSMLSHFERILREIGCPENWQKKITDLELVSAAEMDKLCKWNKTVPESISVPVHIFLDAVFRAQPQAQAVCAWDGELTYGELDDLSTRLAHRIASFLQVDSPRTVALCFEKSMWTVVAILGVMKAGAASVLLDTTLPEKFLKRIVEEVQPCMTVCSSANDELAKKLTPVVSTRMDTLLAEPVPQRQHLPTITASALLCIVFTSGSSTGVPKGVVISHGNFSSALVHQNAALGFTTTSRVLDFASYAWDAAWYNLLHTLYAGGCLCIPSEQDRRNNIAESIRCLRVNFANLTPRLADTLAEGTLRLLNMLELSGESPEASSISRLREHTTVRIAYGPAEATVLSTISTPTDAPTTIGRGLGVCTWVVNRQNSDLLVPIGCIGELHLEGPLVTQGYLNDPRRTSEAFIQDPLWLREKVQRSGRLYRTGDLVRYHFDGSLQYFGRKGDETVKIRGQRVDLAEVEQHVFRNLLRGEKKRMRCHKVLATVTKTSTHVNPTLFAFVVPEGARDMDEETIKAAVLELTTGITDRLSVDVPHYMMPAAYFPLQQIPLTPTDKTDRRHLQNLAKQLQLLHTAALEEETSALTTPTENRLGEVWKRVLRHRSITKLNPNLSFWQAGGDSITVMSLADALRKEFGMSISVSTLSQSQCTLRSLASTIDGTKCRSELERTIDLEVEIQELTRRLQLCSLGERYTVRSSPMTQNSAAFLTGASGFLGIHILRDLLSKRLFKRVIVLVRPAGGCSGLERIRKAAQITGWWEERYVERLEVWEGDLSKDKFGLSTPRWNQLCGKPEALSKDESSIDTIIHNGAVVHWSADYASLRSVNVESTMQLLVASMQSLSIRRFVYISGGKANSDDALHDADASGYVQTKYVSETLVLAAAGDGNQARGKFSVVKPGILIGNVDSGVANIDDFLWRLVRCSIRLQVYPEEAPNTWLAMSEVADVSATILNQCTMADDPSSFVSITSGIYAVRFWAAVKSQLRSSLKPLVLKEWAEIAQKDIESEKEDHPLWPVQGFFRAGTGGQVVVVDETDEQVTRRLENAIASNVRYLQRVGLVGANGSYAAPICNNLIKRSGI